MFLFEKFQVGGNIPNVPPGAGGGRKRQDLRLSAGQSQRGHEGRCMFAVHDNKTEVKTSNSERIYLALHGYPTVKGFNILFLLSENCCDNSLVGIKN